MTQKPAQFTKFSPATLEVKKRLRSARIALGYSMNKGAALLRVSRKQLEDIETIRNYGCHLDLELLIIARHVYCVDFNTLIGGVPSGVLLSKFTERPRKRVGSKNRKR